MLPVLLPLFACGSGATAGSAADGGAHADTDATLDATLVPSEQTDAGPSDARDPGIDPLRCDAGSPTNDGGACDPSRLRVIRRSVVGCISIGQFCDGLVVRVPATDESKLPAGFRCSVADTVATCQWAMPGQRVDREAIDAACSVTQAFPLASVDCIILD